MNGDQAGRKYDLRGSIDWRPTASARNSALWRTLLTLVCFAVMLNPAAGFVNVESMRWYAGEDGFHPVLEFGATIREGNTEAMDLSGAGTIGYRHRDHLAFLLGSVDYGKTGGTNYLNKRTAHLRYNLEFSRRFTWEAFLQYQYDEFRLLTFRGLSGTGLRYLPPTGGLLQTACGLAWMLEREEYDPGPGMEDAAESVLDHRISSYIVVKLGITEVAALENILYLQPRVDRPEDFKVSEEGSLRISLSENVALGISIAFFYDTEPPVSVKKTDLTLKNSLDIHF